MGRSKKNAVNEFDIFESLKEEVGGEILGNLDAAKYFVDTGNLSINYSCSGKFINGGIPSGRLTEIYGPSASSKSLLGANILYGCQKLGGVPILLDTENAVNPDFMSRVSHVDVNKIVRFTPETLEDCFMKIHKTIEHIRKHEEYKDKPIVIVYDSISVSPSAREFREINLPEKYTKTQFKEIVGANEQPGERAKICSKEFRKLNTILEESDASLIVMNQTREKIGMSYGYGPNEAKAGGGTALTYYASLILRTQSQRKLEVKLSGSRKKFIGINLKVSNKKNRAYRPYVDVENIPLYFEKGINPIGGLLGALLDSDRISAAGAGNFIVNKDYSNGEEYKFKSSNERNDVPIQLLYDCPAIIDAKNKEEVEHYLEPFMNCIESTNPEDLEVSDFSDDSSEIEC
jgi:recombination protein RecA